LIYPTVRTIIFSFQDERSELFVGIRNYISLLGNRNFLQVLGNNVLWIVFFTGVVVTFGLLIAVLTDRVRYENAVKALIFLPLAISFVAAGVIWNFMYAFNENVGTLNAAVTSLGAEPVSWLTEWPRNTFMLIVVGIWMWVGFAMVILSAGLKGISGELLEAARCDGATELQVFRKVVLPLLLPTMAVVATTIVITALKTFDIVYVMTAGNFGTSVIANTFYEERFINRDAGSAAAVAVILLLAIIPVMLVNIRRFRIQEEIR
ncbi:MAG: carbohydrate ABC transporter permease, partial [Acidimicrobiia bacterium]